MDRTELVNRSMDYILQHLQEDLSVDAVAAHVFMSKYHFSRMFKEETGESPYAFIKRCKLDQSAIDLKLNPAKAITDIGLDYGYSASNYSAAFKKHRETSPSAFRQSIPAHSMAVPFDPERVAHFQTAEEYGAHIEIRELDDLFVLYERFMGDYADLEKNWYRFLDARESLLHEETVLAERFFHDPSITGAAQCVCDLCMTVEPDCAQSNVLRIDGGKWAVSRFDGEIRDIFETLQGIFSVWLPQSGYRMTRRYGLNLYRRIDRENHRVVMDLCIPVS